jgi:hypothetical protein
MGDRTYRILAVALALGVAGSRIPALLVAASEERAPERVFLGFEADAATVVDLHYYASYVAEARDRLALLLTNRATTEPQDGRVLSLYFTGLGLLSRLTGLSVAATWNVARVAVALLFFWLLFRLLGLFFERPGQRFLAFALVATGGGLGWLMLALREGFGESDALYLADLHKDGVIGYSTFGYLYHPQAILAQCFFLAAVLLWARWRSSGRAGWLAGALACAALIFPAHGPSSPVFYAALLMAPLIPLVFRFEASVAWERLRALAPFALPAALAAAYVLWARGDPVYRGFADTYAQLRHLREPLFFYPVGYGVVFLLAIVGIPRVATQRPEQRDLLLGWTLAALVASANPFLFAWKFQFALHVPLCILAAAGAPWAWERVSRARLLSRLAKRRALAGAGLVAFASISSLFLFGRTLARASDPALFASAEEIEALSALARKPPGNVLGRYRTGSLVIHYTPHRAYLAHYTGTIDPARKDDAVRSFFRADAPAAEKRRFLREASIHYVYYGPRERELGPLDASSLGLRRFFGNGAVEIYEAAP